MPPNFNLHILGGIKVRKIAKHKTVFDSNAIDASHIYAGFDYGGNICVAMERSPSQGNYKMVLCRGYTGVLHTSACRFTQGSSYSYHDCPPRQMSLCMLPNEDRSTLQGTLAAFSEQHSSDIYEFDTFHEFCQWVVELLNEYLQSWEG